MVWFKENIVIYITIFSASCEHWYSATIEKDKDSKVKILKELKEDYPEYFEKKYLSINMITKNSTEKMRNPEFELSNKDMGPTKDTIKTTPDVTAERNKYYDVMDDITNRRLQGHELQENVRRRIEDYNETFTKNIKLRPQRKLYRNRFPTIPQQPKDLRSNITTKPRFLEVFQVVEFDHVSCTSSSGLEGICLHKFKCNADGGSVIGTCADGYGVCCVNLYSCEGSTAATTSWFTNAGFPSPSDDRLSCTFTLNKASDQIKQIRLDFLFFEMLPPSAGVCLQDQFVISGQNINSIVPILCGINTGQHVYFEVSDVDGPINFSIQTVSPERRLFSIKVSQLTSADDLAAPVGCLQYFKDSEGFLESFNYRETSEITATRASSYSNNLNYAMCIQRAAECCSVTYTTAGDIQIVNYDTDGLPVIPPNQAGVEIYNCPSDYLLISATRLCGERLNDGSVLQDFSLDAPITDTSAGPIVIWFRTDEGYVGRGFKLKYQQNSCRISDYK